MDSIFELGVLYYIMDAARNLYKINFQDQLVVTCDINEARKFTYEEAMERIGDKIKYYKVVPVDEAVPRIMDCNNLEVEDKYEYNEKINEEEYENIDGVSANLNKVLEEDYTYEEYAVSDLLGFDVIGDLDKFVNDYYNICNKMKDYYDKLKKQYSFSDMEIIDIMHLIELYNLSDDEYIECCEKLKRVRLERRAIKDEIAKCDALRKVLCNTKAIADVKQAKVQFDSLKNRQYKPRVFSEIFEGKTQIDRKYVINKKDLSYSETAQNVEEIDKSERNKLSEDYKFDNKEVQFGMEYVKKETPYDETVNDWVMFANQLRIFYNNVEQHMVNLNIDLDNIEGKLDELLIAMENENLEDTEALSVAKTIKTLRIERKNKLVELNQLQLMTNDIDVEYLAEISSQISDKFNEIYGEKK